MDDKRQDCQLQEGAVLPVQPVDSSAKIGNAELNTQNVNKREISEEELDTV